MELGTTNESTEAAELIDDPFAGEDIPPMGEPIAPVMTAADYDEQERLRIIKEREDFIRGLRDIANMYEANPELRVPFTYEDDRYLAAAIVIHHEVDTKGKLAKIARIFGSCEKRYEGDYFRLVKFFGPIKLSTFCTREKVCTRIDEEVEVEEQVPTEFVEEVVQKPVAFETKMVTKTVSRWVCDEPLLAATAAAKE